MAADSCGVTNVLMVTTSVGMFNGIHTHTTNDWPVVLLDLVLVVGTTGLEDGLINTTTSGDDSDLASSSRVEGLLGTGWKTDTGLLCVGVVADDGGVVTRGTGNLTAISGVEFDVEDGRTFGDLGQRKDVSDREFGFGSAEDELASVHSLSGNEELFCVLVPVGVFENNTSKRGTTTWVMDDLLD